MFAGVFHTPTSKDTAHNLSEREKMTELAELQQAIAEIRSQRGFDTDPVKIHLLLTEEIGEIASQIKRL